MSDCERLQSSSNNKRKKTNLLEFLCCIRSRTGAAINHHRVSHERPAVVKWIRDDVNLEEERLWPLERNEQH